MRPADEEENDRSSVRSRIGDSTEDKFPGVALNAGNREVRDVSSTDHNLASKPRGVSTQARSEYNCRARLETHFPLEILHAFLKIIHHLLRKKNACNRCGHQRSERSAEDGPQS